LTLRSPQIILVEPQLADNVGAAARAMANFGLSELRLVNPRPDWRSDKARAAASGADAILANARVYPTLAEANRNAAGQWRRAQVTAGQQAFLEAVQGWMRGARGLGPVLAAVGTLLRDKRKAYAVQGE